MHCKPRTLHTAQCAHSAECVYIAPRTSHSAAARCTPHNLHTAQCTLAHGVQSACALTSSICSPGKCAESASSPSKSRFIGPFLPPQPDNFTSARSAPFPSQAEAKKSLKRAGRTRHPKKGLSSTFLLKSMKLLELFDFELKNAFSVAKLLAQPWPARRQNGHHSV